MSDYNWCHGPNCHTYEPQSRVRGTGDNKVLRTIKIRAYKSGTVYCSDYFCNDRCMRDYIHTHLQSIVAIAPRREALETPIKVEKEKYDSWKYDYNDSEGRPQRVPYQATKTTIKSVDSNNG